MIGIQNIGLGLNIKKGGWLDIIDSGQGKFTVDTEAWVAQGTNTIARIAEGDGALEITYVDSAAGARHTFAGANDITTNLTIGKTYKVRIRCKINSGSATIVLDKVSGDMTETLSATSFTWFEFIFQADSVNGNGIRFWNMGAGEVITIDEWGMWEKY